MTLMSEEINNRWAIANLDTAKGTVTVSDSQLKRKKTYHVPYLSHTIIKDQTLLAATTLNKIMEINLVNGSRRFLS